MCRLFGLIANKPVDVEFSMLKARNSFEKQAERNFAGWGVGWYDKSFFIEKYPRSAVGDEKFYAVSKSLVSKIIIAHVRTPTEGKPTIENTHPFKDEENKWILAHNGSVISKAKLENFIDISKLKGVTDSERYFHFILKKIEETNDVVCGIKESINWIVKNCSYTGLNFVMSDGEKLYGFRYFSKRPEYYSLFYLERDPKSEFYKESKDTGMLINSKILKDEKAVLIASEELTDEGWKPINPGELLSIDKSLNVKKYEIINQL